MPHRWESDRRLVLTPHRSLPRRGFAVVIMLFFLFATMPLYGVLGTKVLWGLLPFAMIALGALWWGLQRSYRDGEVVEVLEIGQDEAVLTRADPKGRVRDWRCNPYWVQVEMHEAGGKVPYYVTLKGAGREVEIGAFLSEDERKILYPELLNAFRTHGPQT